MQGIRGKNVLVAGGSSGIGQAIAIRFAEEGANVAINYRKGAADAERTHEIIHASLDRMMQSGGKHILVQADVSDEADIVDMFETTRAELGGLDILIDNAGFQISGASHETATLTRPGIPTAIGIDHYGYVVPDLDQAVAFFTNVLGFELISLDNPIAFSDDSLARWYHVHPRASARFAFLRYGPAIVEFTEWRSPEQNMMTPSNSDLGGRHFAIAVADVDAAMAYLQDQPGVTVFERSVWNFVYFSTPWGMTIQIVQPQVTSPGHQDLNTTIMPPAEGTNA